MSGLKVTVKKEIEVKTLQVQANVRYWEDAVIDGVPDEEGTLTPCRKGDCWCPKIDLLSGQILNWEEGVAADIHFKVCDAGVYTLLDAEGNEVVKKEGYVPAIMSPEENGWGDYIIMKVDAAGQILNWQIDLEEFDEE